MTDQGGRVDRRHAKTMACIVVELYQEGCRFPSRSRRALSAPTNGSNAADHGRRG